jgi:hypothetical protein
MTSANLVAENQADFDAFWCYIWGALELGDRDSQAMAQRLNGQGIFTWEQWVDLGCPAT